MWWALGCVCVCAGRESPGTGFLGFQTPVDTNESAGTSTDSGFTPDRLDDNALVLPSVTVIDADGVRGPVWVVIADGIIQEVSDTAPVGGIVLPTENLWVTPGLIDVHVHLTLSGTTVWVGDTLPDALRATLQNGVTSVVDAGGPIGLFELRDRVEAGEILGPTLKALGPMLTVPLSHPCETLADPDRCEFAEDEGAAAEFVDRLNVLGSDGLKAALTDTHATPWPTPRLSVDVLAAAVDRLDAGMLRYAHVDTVLDALDAVDAGIEVLAHPSFVDQATPEVLALPVWVHSTRGAFSGFTDIADGSLLDAQLDTVPAVVESSWRASSETPSLDDPELLAVYDGWIDNVDHHVSSLIASASPWLVPASDAGYVGVWHGHGLHRELAALAQLGATNLDLLTGVTSRAAEAADFPDRGRVAPGQRADLLVLAVDPLDDLDALRTPEYVVVGGVPWTAEALATVDLLVKPAIAAVGAFCLDDRDCESAVCDTVLHECTDACGRTYDPTDGCGPDATCLPKDGLVTTVEGVCREPWHTCELYGDDCEPAAYEQSCVPVDIDTNQCVDTGPMGQGDSCFVSACAAGLYCSPVDARCYTLCDPEAPSCPFASTCEGQIWESAVWFGLCLP